MNKILKYVLGLSLLAFITIGGTYAVFTASISPEDIEIEAHQIKILYDGDVAINDVLDLVESKEGGFRREVSISIVEDSVKTTGNIYVFLEEISEGLATKALVWELYEIKNGTEEFLHKGNFVGYESGEKVYLIQNLELTKDTKEFAIYLWLNGHEAGNEVRGASLKGYIGAESGIVSGIISE